MPHLTRYLVLLPAVITIIVSTTTAAVVQDARQSLAHPYTIFELEALGGGTSRAFGVNDPGWVVGHVYAAEDRQRAVLWKDGNAVDLGTLGGDEAGALGVNDRDQVVGQSTAVPGTTLEDPGSRAFLWEAGSMQDLGALGGETSVAQDINKRNQIIG